MTLKKPNDEQFKETLRMMTCLYVFARADEGWDGKKMQSAGAPPPEESFVNATEEELRSFLGAGAAATYQCPPDLEFLRSSHDVAAFYKAMFGKAVESAARRQRLALRRDAFRKRTRAAEKARCEQLLDPHYFNAIDAVADPSESLRGTIGGSPANANATGFTPLGVDAFAAYLPNRAGGGLCLVSDLDGSSLVHVQVYAVSSTRAEAAERGDGKDGDEEADGVVSTLVRSDHTAANAETAIFHAVFGEEDAEVRLLFMNVSAKVGMLRVGVRSCDASGNETSGIPALLDTSIAPLQSVEMKADHSTGRALLMRAAQQVVSASNGLQKKRTVSMREELERRLNESAGSYLLVSGMPMSLMRFAGSDATAYWNSLRWHNLDMFVAPSRIASGLRPGAAGSFVGFDNVVSRRGHVFDDRHSH